MERPQLASIQVDSALIQVMVDDDDGRISCLAAAAL